jgi:hypothetical protein
MSKKKRRNILFVTVGCQSVCPSGPPWDGECQNLWWTTAQPSCTSNACHTHLCLQDVTCNTSLRKHYCRWLWPVLYCHLSTIILWARYSAELPVTRGMVWEVHGPWGGHLGIKCMIFEICVGFALFDSFLGSDVDILKQMVETLGWLPDPWWAAFC